MPESAPAPDATIATTTAVAADKAQPSKSGTRPRVTDVAKPTAQRTPSTYELVERKKALQDLIKVWTIRQAPAIGILRARGD